MRGSNTVGYWVDFKRCLKDKVQHITEVGQMIDGIAFYVFDKRRFTELAEFP